MRTGGMLEFESAYDLHLQVAPASLQTLQAFQGMRPKGLTMRAQLHAMLDRALIKLAKLLRETQEIHPWYDRYCACK